MTYFSPLEWQKLNAKERAAALARPELGDDSSIRETVKKIVARVREEGDAALVALALEIDTRVLSNIAVGAGEIAAAAQRLTAEQRNAIDTAAANIERFHTAQLPADIDMETMPGVRCSRVSRPIERVGLYVPAGTAPLPSTALMLGIPAKIAQCPLRVLCSPAQADGQVDPAVLYAAHLCGIDQVFRIGGAQAIAAMAYGTASIPSVDKIFGPGNRWVTAAKTQVSNDPAGAALDMPAGPSEVLVIADASANPEFVAADLLSQAEHGIDSQAVLVTTSQKFAADVDTAVAKQIDKLSRRTIVIAALQQSACIIVPDVTTAIRVSNQYAPEHLILQVENASGHIAEIKAAGSVFVGPWAPESVGDYCSGTNHVLPTYGYARNYSSLGVSSFLRAMTVQELSPAGLQNIGSTAVTLANLEGLDAHAYAVQCRLAKLAEGEQT